MVPYQTLGPGPFGPLPRNQPHPLVYGGIRNGYPSAPYVANYPLTDQYGAPYSQAAPYIQGMGPTSYPDPRNQYTYDSNYFVDPNFPQQYPAGFSDEHPQSAPQPSHADHRPERTGRPSTQDRIDERHRKKRAASRGREKVVANRRETKSTPRRLRKRIEDLESRVSDLKASRSDSGSSQLESFLRALSASHRHDSRSSSGSSGSGVESDQLLLEVIRELLDRDQRQRDRRALLELLDDPNVLGKIQSALWDMYGSDGPDDSGRDDRRRSRSDQYFTVSDASMEPAIITSSRTRPLRHSTAQNLYREPNQTSRTLRQRRPQRQPVIFVDPDEDSEPPEQINQTHGPRRYAFTGPMLTERTFTTGNRDNISRRRHGYNTGTGNQRRKYQAYVEDVQDENDVDLYGH
ncbi:hypothetical protein FALBO_2285 [Fusarium albosuccineum]|uniref:Uncharacterized protein n=1 Tax=Fusarium albosuccineum TaxID=1237068 RepID=A0A8H4PLM0_9HYPO|nr:hypothetical protein FALBO_2285 [Fusarium albosuccineum]